MSTKFTTVKQEPKELHKNTYVIKYPDFMEQIELNKGREPRGNLTSNNHLRFIIAAIGEKYDNNLNAYSIKTHTYEGRHYGNYKELSKIVVQMLKDQYPAIFDSYLHEKIKQRPLNTKLIYYVGDFIGSGPFFAHGIDHIEEKDIDVFLGLKPKKIVGKPAITDEEAKE